VIEKANAELGEFWYMARKPVKRADRSEVIYSEKRWNQLQGLREKAVEIMKALEEVSLNCVTHGSIARGDVSAESDIDVFIPNPSGSFLIESAVERAGLTVNQRIFVQATPSYAAKGYIELDPQRVISFPLMKMRPLERDFYRFGGEATLQTLKEKKRAVGVDKRLMLIEPTERGHVESSVIGRENAVAKLLNVSVETVLDRVHALLRRDEVGRTGVFIKRELEPDETFEMVLQRLANENPAVRRRLRLT
jgi:predicted nucleotidyltransferase